MLTSDEEGGTLDALRFSLASDIVELLVLTGDEVFLQTLREAVGGARRLWHVPSGDKVSDLLVAGEVGILVLDVQALNDGPSVFVGQIKRQFPDLVVVVAGNRNHETSLAGLISAGMVYRFIHKPMSPGRAKLFADAAVKKYEEQRRRAAATAPVGRPSRSHRGVLIGGTIGALGVIAVATWAMHRNSETDGGEPHAADVAHPAATEERLDEASVAFERARKSRGQVKTVQASERARKESSEVRHDLDAAVAGRQFPATIVGAGELTLVKSVRPTYPPKAELSKIEGWVELDFTVAESGAVQDVAVHATSSPGVFENAAIRALSQWRYKPVLRDAEPVPQRARIRMRFTLSS